MSREIKFRTFFNGMMSKPFKFGECVCFPDGSASVGKNFDLMQFIGLHDANGVEIYEGDIVKFYDDYSEEVTIHQVKFYGSKGYPAFELEPSISDDTNGFAVVYQSGDGKLTVIGSIYQNPELLEQN